MLTRRKFISKMLAMTAALSLGPGLSGSLSPEERLKAAEPIPQRKLGKTGEEVSILSLGGEATIEQVERQQEAVEIINQALDYGINYIDTAPSYGGGDSETNFGQVMAERREEVFLASKTHERSYDGTMRLIEESLKRLQTDYLDLYQLHNIRTEQDLNSALASDGAITALEELQQEGVIRFTGITGHKDPELLLRGIREYDFDCLLMSLNAADIHYRPFQQELLEEAREQELGVIAMKVLAAGRLVPGGGIDSIEEALYYTWSFPVSTSIIGTGSLAQLEENVELARNFSPLGEDKMLELENKTAELEQEGNFFKYHW